MPHNPPEKVEGKENQRIKDTLNRPWKGDFMTHQIQRLISSHLKDFDSNIKEIKISISHSKILSI